MKKLALITLLISISFSAYSERKLLLDECRQMAIKHNKSIQMAQESINAATELKKAAFTHFLPNFSANGAYTWNQKNLSMLAEDGLLPVGSKMADGSFGFTPSQVSNSWTSINGQPTPLDADNKPFNPKLNPEKIQWKNYALLPKEALEFDIKNVFVGSIGFVQPLFMGGKVIELYRLAKYGENLANAQKESKITELLLEVDEAYWRIVSVEKKVELAEEYRNLIAKVNSNITIMIEEGVATKAEALKIKVKLNEAEVNLIKSKNGLNLSRMALNQLCGIPLEEEVQLAENNLSEETTIPSLIPIEQAINNRSEIKALEQVEKMAISNEKIMLSRFMPNIGLSGNYLLSSPNVFNGFENKVSGMFSFGLVANIPLFHFGERIHTLNAAKCQHKIASMQIEEVKEKIHLQIKQSSYKVAESQKKRDVTFSNIEQAEENLRYATEGFDAGVITSTDLLGAQTAWLSAKSEYIDASIDLKMCVLYLNKSLGTLK